MTSQKLSFSSPLLSKILVASLLLSVDISTRIF